MSELAGNKHNGTFDIDGRPITGTLTVDGVDSFLYLRDKEFIADHRIRNGCILGTLHDLTKVSLFGCMTLSSGSASRLKEGYEQAELFPHYVLSGNRHLRPDEAAVTRIVFSIDDAASLFHHPRDFGFFFKAGEEVAGIIKKKDREVELGDDPTVVYFSGRREILRSKTRIGVFTVRNTAMPSFGSADGISIDNRLRCAIEFPQPIIFNEAIGHLLDVTRFLDLTAGRQQNVSDVVVVLDEPDLALQSLAVDWSMLKTRRDRRRKRSAHPIDVLIDGARSPAIFGSVLAQWLERNEAWRASRVQFQENFWKQGILSVDRIVADANTFDILPTDAYPNLAPEPLTGEAIGLACGTALARRDCGIRACNELESDRALQSRPMLLLPVLFRFLAVGPTMNLPHVRQFRIFGPLKVERKVAARGFGYQVCPNFFEDFKALFGSSLRAALTRITWQADSTPERFRRCIEVGLFRLWMMRLEIAGFGPARSRLQIKENCGKTARHCASEQRPSDDGPGFSARGLKLARVVRFQFTF